ncbi:MAG: AarF/UbiB family protein, partial [Rubrobacter sp.]|nr:AarF/UbiB family protein [Rubrobacter sp.]
MIEPRAHYPHYPHTPEAMFRIWARQTHEMQETFGRAARRSRQQIEQFQRRGGSPLYSVSRSADLARSQWFLWAGASLTAADRLARAAPAGVPAPSWLPPRTLALGAVALDLYLGYAALRERERWFPWLALDEDWELQHRLGAGSLLDAAQELGGVLIKAAQFASTRPDLLPSPYIGPLSTLQDRVRPRSWEEIQPVISGELQRPPDEIFLELEKEPLASASIAQVHRGILRDGRTVAVKARYPDIEERINSDFDTLDTIFETVSRFEPEIRLQPIADYLGWTLPLELDFSREAEAMSALRSAMSERNDVLVPQPVDELSTGRMIVMEYAEGVGITDLPAMAMAGVEPAEVARLLNEAYAEQIFRHGILHADPHPGNLLVQPGPRLVLLDHGLTVKLNPEFVEILGRMVSALRDQDLQALSAALRDGGMPVDENTNLDTLLSLVGVLLDEGELANSGGSIRRLGASVGDIPP